LCLDVKPMPMPIGGGGAGIAIIAEIIRDLRRASRRQINHLPIDDGGAETAETAETPADQVTRERIASP
jgi:hypothetical protein